MKCKRTAALLLTLSLLLCGCHKEKSGRENRPLDVEPTASYEWMAGESPVPVKRIGMLQRNASGVNVAVSDSGVYFIPDNGQTETYIYYMDNASDSLIKLCGRADCNHSSSDCNAYIYDGGAMTYYRGYLYVLSGEMSESQCELIRLEPDGSGHTVELDLLDFAIKHDGAFVDGVLLTDGYLVFSVSGWSGSTNSVGGSSLTSGTIDNYYYALDGSMSEPQIKESTGLMYSYGDLNLCYSLESRNGGEYGSVWAWEPTTDTMTYLADHPGVPSYFDQNEGYYFKDGTFYRYDCATLTEEALIETELEGKYAVCVFSDCIVLG